MTVITAAMRGWHGNAYISETYPKRFFDVGIAEEHAVTLAAGLLQAAFAHILRFILLSCSVAMTR